MDSFASTAIYLASSLTVGPTPATPPMVIASTVIVAPGMDDIEVSPADHRVEANPFAAARATGGKSLREVIADVVRRDAVEDSMTDAGTSLSLDPERHSRDDEDLSEDITAAHDTRIGFITQRMDELRLEGAPAALRLEQLEAKLRLAMAARCLAVARQASGRLLRHADVAATGPCLPASFAVALNAASKRPRIGHDRLRPLSAHHRASVDAAIASVHSRSPSATARGRSSDKDLASQHVAHIHRSSSHLASVRTPATALVLASTPASHPIEGDFRHPADVASAGASDRARRLLATARHLLEDGEDHRPHANVKLAGLLHWKGSDTWSLADYAKAVA